MSRIGKQPVTIPENVQVSVDADAGSVQVKGPLGSVAVPLPREIALTIADGVATFSPKRQDSRSRALWGLTRSLFANAIRGVVSGYEKRLIVEGIGYKVQLQGNTLVLSLGYSHDITFPAPEGIQFAVEKNVIIVSGFEKQLVGNTAAKIRSFRKPEPYKGKGIRYEGETIRRKAGKKAVAAG